MLVPVGAPSMAEAVRWSAETFQALKSLRMLMDAITRAGYRPGQDISLSMDPAASELFHGGHYEFAKSGEPARSTNEMIQLFTDLVERYPLIFIEDALSEHDWDGWKALTDRLGRRVLLVGDDIFVTNPAIIREAIGRGIGNATLIKLNQIGTVSETLDAIRISHEAGYRPIVSHRSGETEDTFIADLAVAAGAAYIKTGSMARSERVAKYNQLMRIERELSEKAVFGEAARAESVTRASIG